MAETPRFTPAHVALLRVPTLPATRSAATRVDLDIDDVERLAGFLRTVLDDPVLREAVEVSSESLARTLDRLDHGLPVEPAKLRRAALAVTRYLLRMSGRPTPFGLLAGVALARFDDSETAGAATKVRFDTGHRKGVRPDATWLSALVAEWEARPEVRRHLRVVVNDLCQVRDDRLVLPYVRRAAGTAPRERAVQELSVRYTEPVRRAVTAAARPVAYRDLVDGLAAAFPRVAPDRIDALLGTLVAQDILLTDLRPPLTTGDPLGYVLRRLEATDADVAHPRSVAALLARYAAEPPGAGLPAWRDAVAAMRARRTSDRPTIQVDLRVDVDVTLPRAVAEEAARAAAALWRLTPGPTEPPHVTQYRAAFVERYGLDRPVPLGELIDPERGLGAPAGYQVPPADRTLEPVAEPTSARDGILAELVQLALLDGSGEIVLTDEVIERLAGPERHEPPPASVELSVQVLAASTAALDDGTFRLVTGAASSTAGAIFGRFAYLFADGAYLTATAAGATDPPGDPVRAQLVFTPLEPRHANVIQVPKICAETIAVGTFADRSDPTVLGIADLAVVAGHDGLALWSVRHGREIDAVSPHMLVLDYSSANAVRLIREIAASRYREFHTWSWGRLAILPRLPRVRYGRTVLAPATWQVPETLRNKALSWPDWSRELDAWRDRWHVPDRVVATTFDNRVELDLTVPLHRCLLRDEAQRRPHLIVSEAPGAKADTGWLGGHANEVVVPMTVRATPEPARHPARVLRPAPVLAHLPGGEWLYAKLYCGRSRHDEILGARLPDLIERIGSDVDRWFFIRYADPLPHLRVRFHGEPTVLTGTVLPALHDWAADLCEAGLAGRLALDAYEPEVTRYGGPDALEAAERAFAADSAAVLAQLGARGAGLDLAPDLLAAANYVDLLRALDIPDWTAWLLGQFPEGEHHAAFRRIRREALRLVNPTGDEPGLSDVDGGATVRAAWQRRAPAFAAYGRRLRTAGDAERGTALAALLHMNHNRLVGVDPANEARSLAIARGAVAAHLDRARFGS